MCSINVHKTYTDQVLVKKYINRNVQNFTLSYKTFIKQLNFLFLAILLRNKSSVENEHDYMKKNKHQWGDLTSCSNFICI